MSNAIKISRSDLENYDLSQEAVITDVQSIASYNWIEAPKSRPTIVVPGAPALWKPLTQSKQLQKDQGLIYISQNAARHPESPLEPLLRAVHQAENSFDVSAIDIVTDRNNIRKLLSFITPYASGRSPESFTIDIEVVGNTTIFCRAETAAYEVLGPRDFRGFGHEFEKAYTTSQVRGSTGHHRIIKYCFGGMSFLLRYEVDGYVGKPLEKVVTDTKAPALADLSDILGSLSLSSALETSTKTDTFKSGNSALIIRQGGQEVPITDTLEIKTRTEAKPLDFAEVAPQLWLSQTPNLVIAYHNRGTFKYPIAEDVSQKIQSWEQSNQKHLNQLTALIRKIAAAARSCGGKAVLRYDVAAEDVVVISKVERKAMLPDDLYSMWKKPDNVKLKETDNKADSKAASTTPPSSPPTKATKTKIDDNRCDNSSKD